MNSSIGSPFLATGAAGDVSAMLLAKGYKVRAGASRR